MKRFCLIIVLIIMIFSTTVHAATVRIFPGSIGAEITEMNLSQGINEDEVEFIRRLVQDRLVVVIRNQNFTPTQQTFITSQFGDVEIAWDKKNRHPDNCCVHVISNEAQRLNPDYISSTYFWHWDKSFIRYPTSLSFGFFISDPQPKDIGTTGFLNAYTAYESLPADIKEQINELKVVHSYDIMSNLRRQNYSMASLEFKKGNETFPDVIHPLVKIHPSTGKKTLNIDELSQGNIVGMDEQQSTILRKNLFDHAMKNGEFYYHNWNTGDLVIWDNLALSHRGMPSDSSVSRILHRTNISSRPQYEGRCILIGSDVSLNEVTQKLFTSPLILYSDLYNDLSSLETDVLALRSGRSIKSARPNPIVIVQGQQWKKSQKLAPLFNIYLLQNPQESKYERVIGFSKDCGEELENFCLEYFLIQDAHERLLSGKLSSDHLDKKLKILVSSYDTYADSENGFSDQRSLIHAKILNRAFENTNLNKTEKQWFEYLQTIKSHGIQKMQEKAQKNPPTLLFLGGGQGAGKTTLLTKLKENGIVKNDSVIINSRLFFDFLFQDVPYYHKVRLWPYFSKEKQYLVTLIAKIALAHQLSVIVDTHILTHDFCKELTDAVTEFGGKSIMFGLYKPLELCYIHEQQSKESSLEQSHQLIYEQMMFHKLFVMNWKGFVEQFDSSVLIEPISNQILFFSDDKGNFAPSVDPIKEFLTIGCIDPDELANELASQDLSQGAQIIQNHLQNIPLDNIEKLMPPNINISVLDLGVLTTFEKF